MELYVVFFLMTGTILDRVPANVATLSECEQMLPDKRQTFITKFVSMTGADPAVANQPWLNFVVGARCEWVMVRAPY